MSKIAKSLAAKSVRKTRQGKVKIGAPRRPPGALSEAHRTSLEVLLADLEDKGASHSGLVEALLELAIDLTISNGVTMDGGMIVFLEALSNFTAAVHEHWTVDEDRPW